MGPYQRHMKHITDAIIQEFTRSQFSHAAFYFLRYDVPEEIQKKFKCTCEHWLFEAKKDGNHFKPFLQTDYIDDYDWVALRLRQKYQCFIPGTLDAIKSFEGDPYNFWSTYFMGAVLLLPNAWRWLKAWIYSQPNPFAIDQAHYCSEVVVDAFLAAGLDIAANIGLNKDNVAACDLRKCEYFEIVRC